MNTMSFLFFREKVKFVWLVVCVAKPTLHLPCVLCTSLWWTTKHGESVQPGNSPAVFNYACSVLRIFNTSVLSWLICFIQQCLFFYTSIKSTHYFAGACVVLDRPVLICSALFIFCNIPKQQSGFFLE